MTSNAQNSDAPTLFELPIRDMRLAVAAHYEPGNLKIAQDIEEHGLEEIFLRIPIDQRIDVVQAYESIMNCGGVWLTPQDDCWPQQLNDLKAPPMGVIVKGDASVLTQQSLAIVGTRNPTPYGIRAAQEFAAGFVDREWSIVSGGAYGIDSAAHKGALIAEGATIAVTASGLDSTYPAGNQRLFDEIVENGAIVTEYLPGSIARPHRFLVRNRLIAALSKGTLVVEAAFRSGSLRTARDAADLMRPVMAIPGPITAPTSEGCHRLIGERSAEIVTSVADAYELLAPIS
jgi:DNA processing protein